MKKGEAILGLLLIAGFIGGALGIGFKATAENGVFKANMKNIWCKVQAKDACGN